MLNITLNFYLFLIFKLKWCLYTSFSYAPIFILYTSTVLVPQKVCGGSKKLKKM